LEKMKVIGPPTKEKMNSWQRAKHAWLYSDLLKALKRKKFSALDSRLRGP